MIPRERYLRTMTFQPFDRVPLIKWPIVDCDGYPGNELTALWLDAGVDAAPPAKLQQATT